MEIYELNPLLQFIIVVGLSLGVAYALTIIIYTRLDFKAFMFIFSIIIMIAIGSHLLEPIYIWLPIILFAIIVVLLRRDDESV